MLIQLGNFRAEAKYFQNHIMWACTSVHKMRNTNCWIKGIVWSWDTIPYIVYLKRPKLLTYEILFLCGWLIWLGREGWAVSWRIGIFKTCRWVLSDYMLTQGVPSVEWLLGRRLSTPSECQGTPFCHISHPKVQFGRLSVRASRH